LILQASAQASRLAPDRGIGNDLFTRPVHPLVVALPVGVDRKLAKTLQEGADRRLAGPRIAGHPHQRHRQSIAQEPAHFVRGGLSAQWR